MFNRPFIPNQSICDVLQSLAESRWSVHGQLLLCDAQGIANTNADAHSLFIQSSLVMTPGPTKPQWLSESHDGEGQSR